MIRRDRRLVLGVGAAAAALGLAAAAWRRRGAPAEDSGAGVADAAGGEGPGSDGGLWPLRLPRPEGGELALASLRGRPLLVNFWATWCPPCIREMPQIDRFAREFAGNGWQVLGIAADQAEAVRAFLGRNPVGYPIALAGFDGIALSRRLGNTGGGLPFTVAFDAQGRVARRHLGEIQYEVLAAWGKGA